MLEVLNKYMASRKEALLLRHFCEMLTQVHHLDKANARSVRIPTEIVGVSDFISDNYVQDLACQLRKSNKFNLPWPMNLGIVSEVFEPREATLKGLRQKIKEYPDALAFALSFTTVTKATRILIDTKVELAKIEVKAKQKHEPFSQIFTFNDTDYDVIAETLKARIVKCEADIKLGYWQLNEILKRNWVEVNESNV